MKMTCDACGFGSHNLRFDDIQPTFGNVGAAYLCDFCFKVNDALWAFDGIRIKADMEIQSVKRAFGRMRSNV